MSKLILSMFMASLMLWSSLLFAHNPDVTKHPLTLSFGILNGHFYIRFTYHLQTLKDLYEQGNPLKLSSWGEYHDELTRKMTPPKSQPSYIHEASNLFATKLFEIKYICFFMENNRVRFFSKIERWINSNGLAPFIHNKTQQNILESPHDELLQQIPHELMRHGMPISLIPPFATRVLSCGDNIVEAAMEIQEKGLWCPSPAYRFASLCHERRVKTDLILAGDILINEVQSIEYAGQSIVGIYLNNRLPFKEQLEELGYGTIKFQLVLGLKLLCCCQSEFPTLCCGGFDLAAHDRPILKFLANVASVLDETAASIAVLSGHNPIDPLGFDNDVLTFNQAASGFEAKIFKNDFGEFYGIVIQKAQILPADDEKQRGI